VVQFIDKTSAAPPPLMTLERRLCKNIATMSFHSDSTSGGSQPGLEDEETLRLDDETLRRTGERIDLSDPSNESNESLLDGLDIDTPQGHLQLPRRAPQPPGLYRRPRSPTALGSPTAALSPLSRSASPAQYSDPPSEAPSSPSSPSSPAPARDHLAFAPVALAQYHNIQEKLADNNVFRLLRSPAPIRVWVYRSLLRETRLWDEWSRKSNVDRNMAQTQSRGESPMDDVYEESVDSSEYDTIQARPYLTRLRLALAPYTVHFRNPGYIRDETLRMLERDVVKKTLEDSRKRLELREELGLSWEFWDDLAAVLKAAIPSLEKRCFAQPDPAAPEYEGLSGPLIASYSPSLLRDLERLNQLVCVARNVLVQGERTQNLAAERLFDKDIFNLVNVCVRVTARGYDGEAGTQDEDKWQGVINAYKKLLITCLQFLNNLIARNEQRKLMLWIELFDSHLDNELPNFADMKYRMDEFKPQDQDAPPQEPMPEHQQPARSLDTFKIPQQPASSPFLLYIGETGNEVKKALMQHGDKAGANEIAAECRRRWQTMGEDEKNVRNPESLI
jgi:palmitoyltransferase